METYKPENSRFIELARKYADRIGVAEIAKKYKCSTTHIYQIINEDKNAGLKVQTKFAQSCGFATLQDFLNSEQLHVAEETEQLKRENDLLRDLNEMLKAENIRLKEENAKLAGGSDGKSLGEAGCCPQCGTG